MHRYILYLEIGPDLRNPARNEDGNVQGLIIIRIMEKESIVTVGQLALIGERDDVKRSTNLKGSQDIVVNHTTRIYDEQIYEPKVPNRGNIDR